MESFYLMLSRINNSVEQDHFYLILVTFTVCSLETDSEVLRIYRQCFVSSSEEEAEQPQTLSWIEHEIVRCGEVFSQTGVGNSCRRCLRWCHCVLSCKWSSWRLPNSDWSALGQWWRDSENVFGSHNLQVVQDSKSPKSGDGKAGEKCMVEKGYSFVFRAEYGGKHRLLSSYEASRGNFEVVNFLYQISGAQTMDSYVILAWNF